MDHSNERPAAPGTRRMDRVETEIMEPMMDGTYRERAVEKFSYQCLGCGLVWAIEWHAAECGKRGHKAEWQQGPYGVTHVVNGKPMGNLKWYPRYALRRAPLD